eukprot:TRINITY_DN4080_c0_g1_i5.p1 TRINITY_DN4080_c0_g1~~TRINITY_DN4080_c0_g1_i5.p1  ORF type:complete len:1808 (+),score=517.68 TRINITY_DN4080_c0_g1_i5:315-5426(+)
MYDSALKAQQDRKQDEAERILTAMLDLPILSGPLPRTESSRLDFNQPAVMLLYLSLKNLANIHEERGTPQSKRSALQYLVRAIDVDDRDVVVWHRIALLACEFSNYALARHALENGLRRVPNHWLCMHLLAEVLYTVGDYGQCLALLGRMQQMEPGLTSAKLLDMQIKIETGDMSPFHREAMLYGTKQDPKATAMVDRLVQGRKKRIKIADMDHQSDQTHASIFPRTQEEQPATHNITLQPHDMTWRGLGVALQGCYDRIIGDTSTSMSLPIHILLPPVPIQHNPIPPSNNAQTNETPAVQGGDVPVPLDPVPLDAQPSTPPSTTYITTTTTTTTTSHPMDTSDTSSALSDVEVVDLTETDQGEATTTATPSATPDPEAAQQRPTRSSQRQPKLTSKMSASPAMKRTNKDKQRGKEKEKEKEKDPQTVTDIEAFLNRLQLLGNTQTQTQTQADTTTASTTTTTTTQASSSSSTSITPVQSSSNTPAPSTNVNTPAPPFPPSTGLHTNTSSPLVDEDTQIRNFIIRMSPSVDISSSSSPSSPPTDHPDILAWMDAYLSTLCSCASSITSSSTCSRGILCGPSTWDAQFVAEIVGLYACVVRCAPSLSFRPYTLTIAELHFDQYMLLTSKETSSAKSKTGKRQAERAQHLSPLYHLSECEYHLQQVFLHFVPPTNDDVSMVDDESSPSSSSSRSDTTPSYAIRVMWLKARLEDCTREDHEASATFFQACRDFLSMVPQPPSSHTSSGACVHLWHCKYDGAISHTSVQAKLTGLLSQQRIDSAATSLTQGNYHQVIEMLEHVLHGDGGLVSQSVHYKRDRIRMLDLLLQACVAVPDYARSIQCVEMFLKGNEASPVVLVDMGPTMLERLSALAIPRSNPEGQNGTVPDEWLGSLRLILWKFIKTISLALVNVPSTGESTFFGGAGTTHERLLSLMVRSYLTLHDAIFGSSVLAVPITHATPRLTFLSLVHADLGRRRACSMFNSHFLQVYVRTLCHALACADDFVTPTRIEDGMVVDGKGKKEGGSDTDPDLETVPDADQNAFLEVELVQCFHCLYGVKLTPPHLRKYSMDVDDHGCRHSTKITNTNPKNNHFKDTAEDRMAEVYLLLRRALRHSDTAAKSVRTLQMFVDVKATLVLAGDTFDTLTQEAKTIMHDIDVYVSGGSSDALSREGDPHMLSVDFTRSREIPSFLGEASNSTTRVSSFPFVQADLFLFLSKMHDPETHPKVYVEAIKRDLCVNPGRAEAWVNWGITNWTELRKRIEDEDTKGDCRDIFVTCCQCFKLAHKLEPSDPSVSKTLGTVMYAAHGHRDLLPAHQEETHIITEATDMFARARVNDSDWFIPYMLGKLGEKIGLAPVDFLAHYAASVQLARPKKDEAEPHYRLHASRLKLLLGVAHYSNGIPFDAIEAHRYVSVPASAPGSERASRKVLSLSLSASSSGEKNGEDVQPDGDTSMSGVQDNTTDAPHDEVAPTHLLDDNARRDALIQECISALADCRTRFTYKWFFKSIYRIGHALRHGPHLRAYARLEDQWQEAQRYLAELFKPSTKAFFAMWIRTGAFVYPGKMILWKRKYLALYLQVLVDLRDDATLDAVFGKLKREKSMEDMAQRTYDMLLALTQENIAQLQREIDARADASPEAADKVLKQAWARYQGIAGMPPPFDTYEQRTDEILIQAYRAYMQVCPIVPDQSSSGTNSAPPPPQEEEPE